MKAKQKHFPFKHFFTPHRISEIRISSFLKTSRHKIVKTTNVRCIARFVENNITQLRSQALFMSGASKFHTWKFSWFERLIYNFFARHGKLEPSDSDELGKATCVMNTRVTEYSVYHLFLLLLSSCSILGVRKKKLHLFTRST